MSTIEKKNPLDDMQHLEDESEQLEIGDEEDGNQRPVEDYNFDMDDIENDQSEDGEP